MSGQQPPAIPAFYAGQDAVTQFNVMASALTFLRAKVAFRARRAATGTVTKNAHTLVPWDTIDEDPYSGWAGGTPTKYTVQAPGWYAVCGTISASGTGAANTVMIPAISVNGLSPTGQPASPGWEGPELFIPTGTDPKCVSGFWEIYCNLADIIELDVFLSSEPAANFAWQTTSGQQTRIEIVWMGV